MRAPNVGRRVRPAYIQNRGGRLVLILSSGTVEANVSITPRQAEELILEWQGGYDA